MLKSAKPFLFVCAALLRKWASPRQNPFVAQAAHALSRRNIAVRLAFWFAVHFVVVWATAVFMETSFDHKVEVPVVGAETAIGLSWVWALWTARFRLSTALQTEWLKQRLIPILLSPLSPEEVAALSGAPAVLLAVFVSTLSLPAWALGLGCGFLSPLDAFGFALLLLVACVGFPSWSSAAWEAQLNAKAQPKGSSKSTQVQTSSLASSGETLIWSALFLALFFVGSALLFTLPQQAAGSILTWVSMWPPEITSLFGHLYAVPLLLSRLLVYPLPFFCVSLPLWIALAPFWVNTLRTSHATLSCALEARRGSQEKRVKWVEAIWRPVRGWWAPLALGFALPVVYKNYWLAAWRSSTPMFPSKWGIEADVALSWWHGVIAWATFTLWIWLRSRASQPEKGEHSWNAVGAAFKTLVPRAIAGAALAGILGPLLCGHNPIPLPLGLFLVQMALVAATWLTIQLALARENSIVNKGLKISPGQKFLRWFLALWMWGAPLLLALVSFALSWGKSIISPLSWPFCLMSPTTLWFAPRFETSLHSPQFYGAALLHFALASLLWMRARTLRAPVVAPSKKLIFARRRTLAALQMVLQARQSPDFAPQPTAKIPAKVDTGAQTADAFEINAPETAALRTATRIPLPTPNTEQDRFLNRFARFDNALLRLELRRAMGKAEWIQSAREGGTIGAAAVLFFSILIPALAIAYGLLFGFPKPGSGNPTFADMEWIYCLIVVLPLLLTCVDVIQKISNLYDRDRLDGSLDFLFLTPLETRAIVAGKLAPPLVRGACFLAGFWPSLFTIAILLSLAGDFRLWPFAFLTPILAWALCARAVAWLHLVAVAKTNSKWVHFAAMLGLFALPLLSGLAVFCAAPDGFSPTNWEVPVVLLLLFLIPLFLLDCAWPHRWSVRLLERERVRR